MNGWLAVFSREIGERRLVFAAAATLGLVPFASPLLAGGRAGLAGDATLATALVLALALSTVLAAALGASVIGGDLAERRLSFYFVRPLSGWAIWSGKLGAAFALALGAGLVVLLPATLAHRVFAPGLVLDPGVMPLLLAAWPAGLLLVVLAAHALGIIGRARTPWTLLDLAAALAVGGLAWFDFHQLQAWDDRFGLATLLSFRVGTAWAAKGAGPDEEALAVWVAGAAALGLAFAVASAVQVVAGRTDLRRAHRLLSSTLWSVLLAAALAGTAWTAAYVRPAPSALQTVFQLTAGPAGRWVAIDGSARRRGFPPDSHFLVDRSTGRWLRIRPGVLSQSLHAASLAFAADGRSAAWLEPGGEGNRRELVRVDLTRPIAGPRPTQLSFDRPALALSPDGGRVAAIEHGRLVVADLASGRLLASTTLSGDQAEFAFLSADRLRLFEVQGPIPARRAGELEIAELELPGGRLREVARIAVSNLDGYSWLVSPDAERLLIHVYEGKGLAVNALYDAGTGRVLARLPLHDERGRVEFLPGGQLVETVRSPVRHEVRLLTRDGAPDPGTRPLPLGHRVTFICAQPSPTELLAVEIGNQSPAAGAARGRAGGGVAGWRIPFRLLRLDLARGTSTQILAGMVPPDLLPEPLSAVRSPAFLAHTALGWTWIDAAGRRSPLLPGGG
jgi:hypothetical protein